MNLILISGIQGTTLDVAPLARALEPGASVTSLNLLGHGRRDIPPALTVSAMAADIAAQMDQRGLRSAHLCGYSFGGYVALYLARHYPDRVQGVTTIATKTQFDRRYTSLVIFLLARMLDPAENKQPQVERRLELERLHGPQWKELCRRNLDMCIALSTTPALSDSDLRQIAQPCLCIGFEEDQLVSRAETIQLSVTLPNCKSVILPGSGHPFASISADVVAAEMRPRLLS